MRRIRILLLILSLCMGLVACRKGERENISLEQIEEGAIDEDIEENTERTEDVEYIFIYVCGAVNCAGVYELPSGSRVYQAIEVAGGLREDADVKSINQAEIVEDEECIYVPVIGESPEMESEESGKININKASKEELMTLPGVGESRAEGIIKYREDVGAFQNIEDIMQVSGIKEGLFEKIKDLITI